MSQPFSLPVAESRLLVAAASLLVPRMQRAEWRAEWNAEMWHAWQLLNERGETRANARRQLRSWSLGSFQDAAWYRAGSIDREKLAARWHACARTPGFCLGALATLLLAITLCSGLLSATRSVMMPLKYADAGRIATVSEASVSLAMRYGPRLYRVRQWQSKSRSVDGIATYLWHRAILDGVPGGRLSGLDAQVSPRFFSLLKAGTSAGRLWTGYGTDVCTDCAVLSYDFAVSRFGRASDAIARRLVVDGRTYRITGVLSPGFWFLSRNIPVWTPASGRAESDPSLRTGVVVRLASDVTPEQTEQELLSIVRAHEAVGWDYAVTVSPVQRRVRSVLLSFALGLVLATVIVLAGVRLRIPLFPSAGHRRAAFSRLAPFFAVKTGLALLIVLLAGLEFTPAASITMIGGTDLRAEPISTWLFLVGCMGALSWSIRDQRRRCRVCVRRLGLCAQVGCSGCLLLNWAGTEMVCIEGHGMLHVPEMLSSWNEPDHWTVLDESWQGLFSGDPV